MAGSPVEIKGYMDIAYLSTLSALAGSVVGGLTSGVATWLSQRAQARKSQLAREMARRDDLQRVHRRGIEGIRQSHCEQRAKRSGTRCPLGYVQQDAGTVPAANCRVRREGHADNNRSLLCTW